MIVVVRFAPLVVDADKEETTRSGGPTWIELALVLFVELDSPIGGVPAFALAIT